MSGIRKRILVGFSALVLAPLAALQAGEAVKVAVSPALAGVMREIIGETAERAVVSGQGIVWRPGYQKLQPPPECEVIVTGSDSEMDALARHGHVIAGSRAVIAEAELKEEDHRCHSAFFTAPPFSLVRASFAWPRIRRRRGPSPRRSAACKSR